MRNFFWRLGRKLYLFARSESNTSQFKNGEFYAVKKIISRIGPGPHSFVDIGANNGSWVDEVKIKSLNFKIKIDFFIIEPSSDSFEFLNTIYGGFARCIKLALSDTPGTSTLKIYGDSYGINSLYDDYKYKVAFEEKVNVETFDNLCIKNNILKICYVKSDSEGNCFNILKGATESFNAGAIQFWQFEYNHRWLYSRTSLLDVFNWLNGKPYVIGKLTKKKIYIFKEWHFELDRFFETNYILIRRDSLKLLDGMIEFYEFDKYNSAIKIGDVSKYIAI
jgi:FkbM family methyltransferase